MTQAKSLRDTSQHFQVDVLSEGVNRCFPMTQVALKPRALYCIFLKSTPINRESRFCTVGLPLFQNPLTTVYSKQISPS